MTDLTREQLEALLDGATQGPWQADGEPWNRIVWSSAENRVCFMAHSNGLDDARDIATSNLVAAAPDLARQLLATMTERDEAQAAQAGVVEKAEVLCQIEVDRGDKNNQPSYASSARACRNAIRVLVDPTGVKMLEEMRARAEKAEAERDQARGWLGDANNEFGSAAWDWPDLWRRIAQLKELSNERWKRAEAAEAQLAEVQKREAGLREALTEAVEIVHKSYVAATMEAVNAGPSHPIKDKYDAWRARCMNAETKARAALSAAPTGEESNG